MSFNCLDRNSDSTLARNLPIAFGILMQLIMQPSTSSGNAATLAAGFYPIGVPVAGTVDLAGSSETGWFAAGTVEYNNSRQLFVWDPDSGSRLINLPSDRRLRSVSAVSGNGLFVGGAYNVNTTPASPDEAFLWSEVGGFESLGRLSPDGGDSWVEDISFDGSVVVGIGDTPHGPRAFRWTESSGIGDLGTLGRSNASYDPFSYANSVAANGAIIAGITTVSGMSEGQMAAWDASGGWRVIGSLPGGLRNAGATGISANGSIVVGYDQGSNHTNNGFHPIIWTAETGMKTLPTIRDYFISYANEVSNDGNFVTGQASYYTTQSAISYAVAWELENGEYQISLLTDLMKRRGLDLDGWTIASVSSMSADGRVLAGNARDGAGRSRGYVAVLPIPEPSTGLLVTSFLGFLFLELRVSHRHTELATNEEKGDAAQFA